VKAVILAGGEGTRLRPLTSNQPKPMMPLANQPMMEHVVRLLASHGFDDIVVAPDGVRIFVVTDTEGRTVGPSGALVRDLVNPGAVLEFRWGG